jgi:hypothetical protein
MLVEENLRDIVCGRKAYEVQQCKRPYGMIALQSKAGVQTTSELPSNPVCHPERVEYTNDGERSFYRARVDPKHRFHFKRLETHYLILAIGPHRLQGIG